MDVTSKAHSPANCIPNDAGTVASVDSASG